MSAALWKRLGRKRPPQRTWFTDDPGALLWRIYAQTEWSKSGCLEWNGAKTKAGYGLVSFRNKRHYVHRIVYGIINSVIPDGMLVMHSCDNPCCINLQHLVVGTDADNMADMQRKGRRAKGVDLPGSILTDDAVREMRRRYKSKDKACGATALGKEFGVGPAAAWAAIVGKTWRHVQ